MGAGPPFSLVHETLAHNANPTTIIRPNTNSQVRAALELKGWVRDIMMAQKQ